MSIFRSSVSRSWWRPPQDAHTWCAHGPAVARTPHCTRAPSSHCGACPAPVRPTHPAQHHCAASAALLWEVVHHLDRADLRASGLHTPLCPREPCSLRTGRRSGGWAKCHSPACDRRLTATTPFSQGARGCENSWTTLTLARMKVRARFELCVRPRVGLWQAFVTCCSNLQVCWRRSRPRSFVCARR